MPEEKFDVDSYHAFRFILVKQYQNEPKFHSMVDHFHCMVQGGEATFDGLFGALFLAKEMFVRSRETAIHELKRVTIIGPHQEGD